MKVTIMMGNQDIYLIWNIFKIINILIKTLYLMFPPLIFVKTILMMKSMNLFMKEVTHQITIHLLQCMLTLQNINTKKRMLIRSRKILGKEKPFHGKNIFDERLLTDLK